ncbi:MAG: CDGSH iron-sulfur domain-containing protein [Deltaproteobacteria bacterium]|nr:MAG: CDGSH iron-sulfur domain-containing protein [Deltaproteobacteria bacterium]
MHVFYCKPLKALRAAELAGDDEAAREIARVVGGCPSGALTWEAKVDGFAGPSGPPQTPVTEADRHAQIAVQEGGEIRVQCAFDLDAETPERNDGERTTLCRCGLSTNKPFCDGRHKKREDGFR